MFGRRKNEKPKPIVLPAPYTPPKYGDRDPWEFACQRPAGPLREIPDEQLPAMIRHESA